MNTPEIINIDMSEMPETVDMGSNFNDDIGLLMNSKKKNASSNSLPDLDNDLQNLEKELNMLTGDDEPSNKIVDDVPKNDSGFLSSFMPKINFNDDNVEKEKKDLEVPAVDIKPVEIPNLKPININFDESTNKTWDGFSSTNDNETKPVNSKPILTKEQLLREKYKILRKLDKIEDKGARLSKKYSIDDSLEEMTSEYDELIEEKVKSNAVKFYGSSLTSAVQLLEWVNGSVDPFDFKLDGWAESVEQNLEDYDEIFEELHEKYKSKGKMAPELRLLYNIGASAVQVHFSNQILKMAMPGADQIFNQNPELAQQFTNAALNTMSKDAPGFANFMNETSKKNPPQRQERQQRTSNMKKQTQFDDGVNMEDNYGDYNSKPKKMSFMNDRERENQYDVPDMKGPDNLDELLSVLKTEKVKTVTKKTSNGSTVSIDELQSIRNDADNFPKKSRKKGNSKRKSISMDL
jgi:hypothetical protein